METFHSYNVVRVFVDDEGKFGNPVGIVVDEGQEFSSDERQALAAELGFSETLFVDDIDAVRVSIFNPVQPVDFAGHALVGVAWYLHRELGVEVDSIESIGKSSKVWEADELSWLQTVASLLPPWNLERLDDVSQVQQFPESEALEKEHALVWAWEDEQNGLIRARTFAPDWGILEDEANGSGSMLLALRLGRDITVIHGKGSVIKARCLGGEEVAVGGRCVLDTS